MCQIIAAVKSLKLQKILLENKKQTLGAVYIHK